MFGEIGLPFVLMLIKSMLKLFMDKEVNRADMLRTMAWMPTDIIFLAFAYGLALVYGVPNVAVGGHSLKNVFTAVLTVLLVGLFVVIFCRWSDRALSEEREGHCVGWFVAAMIPGVFILLIARFSLELVK